MEVNSAETGHRKSEVKSSNTFLGGKPESSALEMSSRWGWWRVMRTWGWRVWVFKSALRPFLNLCGWRDLVCPRQFHSPLSCLDLCTKRDMAAAHTSQASVGTLTGEWAEAMAIPNKLAEQTHTSGEILKVLQSSPGLPASSSTCQAPFAIQTSDGLITSHSYLFIKLHPLRAAI